VEPRKGHVRGRKHRPPGRRETITTHVIESLPKRSA
jgi:hypothetical protein